MVNLNLLSIALSPKARAVCDVAKPSFFLGDIKPLITCSHSQADAWGLIGSHNTILANVRSRFFLHWEGVGFTLFAREAHRTSLQHGAIEDGETLQAILRLSFRFDQVYGSPRERATWHWGGGG